MSPFWVALCFLLHGAKGFMIHHIIESLCLQDSPSGNGVKLRKCNLDNDLQEWEWRDQRFLQNVGTQRCLSAFHERPVLSVECDDGEHLEWGCQNLHLLSLNRSLELSAEKGRLRLSPGGHTSRWRSLDKGDICQERLRSKRASNEFEREFEQERPAESSMNQEQRDYLKWFYRTEDQSKWTFAMLALAFAGLLLGCILLVTGMMGSRSRKKIAKYKAAALAQKPQMEELQVITKTTEMHEVVVAPELDYKLPTMVMGAPDEAPVNGELKPGDIVVTWKDGTTSSLYDEKGGEADGGEVVAEVEEADEEKAVEPQTEAEVKVEVIGEDN